GGGAGSRLAGSIVDITHHKQALLRHDLEQAVAALLSEATSARSAMPALLQLLATQLGWCCGAVWMQGSDDATPRQVASWALPESRLTHFLELSRDSQQQQLCRMLAGAALATSAPVMLGDLDRQRRFGRLQAAREAGLGCALAVPLRAAGQSVGVLELFGPAPRSLDAGWLRSVLAIGQHAGQALQRERAESALVEARTQLQVMLAHGPDSFYVHDALGQICDVNQSACDMLGYQRDELLLLEHSQVDADLPFRRLQELVDADTQWQSIPLPSRHRRRDGSLFPVEIRVGRIELGSQSRWVTVARDLSLCNELKAQMKHLACHDPLTGLHNRAMFSRQLNVALGRARQGGSGLAVLLIDLDRFKLINDALGHHAGDRLLQEMARRLRSTLPPGAAVARMGGDEFIVLINEAAMLERLPQLASQILQTLVIEYPLEGQRLHITASIGISTCPQDGHDEYTLVKRADQAMYRAKAAGKNTCVLYSLQMDPSPAAQLSLESDLRRAIERNALTLRFQPKVSVQTACITGSEVLVRWQHDELGLLQPEDFIPIAEETGLIVPLTKWIMVQACRQN
ncbi:MAG: diguanylate cyclase, partial [Lacisediminimonas sp.]|nr:diguanylate cyclase [Lacisediminimonas sp.]